MRRIPPLNHVRVFEVAARVGSFKRAASELCVTDSAVSQHIHALEDFLGAPLFIRSHTGVTLTPAGHAYASQLTHILDQIADATDKFMGASLHGTLRVSVAPSLGTRWLIPRMDLFASTYPGFQLDPIVTPEVVDLSDGSADIAIRHGDGNWSGLDVTFVRDEMLVPVASQCLIGQKRISETSDLFDYPLLSAKTRSDEWPNWFANQGEKLPKDQRFIIYDSIALVIDAAIAGVGIALVDKLLIKDDIRRKLLRVLIDKPLKGLNAYYVVTQTVKTPDPKTILFRNWLLAEFARDME